MALQVDDMLAQAQSVSRSLLEQRRIFSNVQDKLVTVGERFPVINGLLNAVRRRKSKVRFILSLMLPRAKAGRVPSEQFAWHEPASDAPPPPYFPEAQGLKYCGSLLLLGVCRTQWCCQE